MYPSSECIRHDVPYWMHQCHLLVSKLLTPHHAWQYFCGTHITGLTEILCSCCTVSGSSTKGSNVLSKQTVSLLQFFLLFMVHAYNGLVVGKGPDCKSIGDGPWHWLWPCLVPWLLLQTATSMGWLHNVSGMYQLLFWKTFWHALLQIGKM